MGRGESQPSYFSGARRTARDLIGLRDPGVPPDIGSEAHRLRLQDYARARMHRFQRPITLEFSGSCGRCKHDIEEHAPGGGGCTKCAECSSYAPNGVSMTDMHGNIVVQKDVPPAGSFGEREVAIRGLLRHELCHEQFTDPAAYFAFWKDIRNGDPIAAEQLKWIHNVLEDGMIEERERELNPSSYKFISGLNRIHPRCGKTERVEEEMVTLAPPRYTPLDADGNKLEVFKGEGGRRMVRIPAGTMLGPWGKRPISLTSQMRSALLAEALPEHSPGELHPKVQKALDECRPYIDQAVRGNTSDCILHAYKVLDVLRNHGLERGDLTEEEKEQLEQLAKAMQQMQPTAPEASEEGSSGEPQPATSPPVPGDQLSPSPELSEQLGGQQDGEQAGSRGKGEDADDKDAQGAGADADGRKEDGGDDQPGESGGAEQKGSGSGGESSSDSGLNNGACLPQGVREENERSGKGRLDGEELEKRIKESGEQVAHDKAEQRRQDTQRLRKGKIEASDWNMPEGHSALAQGSLSDSVRRSGQRALPKEQGQISRAARQLGDQIKRIKHETRAPQRMQRRGRIDPRRIHKVMSGRDTVFYKPGQNLDLNMEFFISIDRSGSITDTQQVDQYRMAKMFGYMSRETKVPMTIWGWDGGGPKTRHYAYKESHSNDLTAIDSLFQTGGGGTPTHEAIRVARSNISRSSAGMKTIVVITDGGANRIEETREQVLSAEREGIKVLGLAFKANENHIDDVMDEQFGKGNWIDIDDYTKSPRIIGNMIRKAAARVRSGN